MAKNKEVYSNESAAERLSRWGRNINALGAAAIAGVAGAIPGPNAILAGLAGLNAIQAGGFELWHKSAKKKRKKKKNN